MPEWARLADVTWRMRPEWEPHERTWMSYPCDEPVRSSGADSAWVEVANTLVQFEPVMMLVPAEFAAEATRRLDGRIEQLEVPLDSCWLRDNGPTFVVDDETGELGAVWWRFNAWGQPAEVYGHALDAAAGAVVAEAAGATVIRSELVNEGGAIHTDGRGRLLATRSVQQDRRRNPDWTEAEIEAEFRRCLGVDEIVWFDRGLEADMTEWHGGWGTNGHVDVFACFADHSTILVHTQPDPNEPDHAVCDDIRAVVDGLAGPDGAPLRVLELPAPARRHPDELSDDSYVNYALVEGAVVHGTYDDPAADERAAAVLAEAFPGREIVGVPAGPIFDNGGGIHCITQHQPATGAAS